MESEPRTSGTLKLGLLVAVGLVLTTAVVLFAQPYLMLGRVRDAARKGDRDALAQCADFPALRENLKASLNASMAKHMQSSLEDNPFAGLGVVFAGVLVDRMVDAYVTPSGIATLAHAESPDSMKAQEERSEPQAAVKVTQGYKGASVFHASVQSDTSASAAVTFVFTRRGLSWRLTDIRLPDFSSQRLPIVPESAEDKAALKLLVPTLSNKRFQASDYSRSIYEDFLSFDIDWDTSGLPKPTRAIKGVLIVADLFGETKTRIAWTINKPLTPGEPYHESGMGFEYNQFRDADQWMRSTDLSDMTFTFRAESIIYQDGSQENFPQ